MAQKPTPGSITTVADSQKSRVNNISNVSSAINDMQRDVDQKIAETQKEVRQKKDTSQIHDSMNQTLSGLNRTISALTTGVAKITTDTARATADAVKQYGQAISQDISFNKKSVVAMALAQTSPLYGYFVAKFVETDVFKRALNKMKMAVSQTIGAIVRPLKGRGAVKGGGQVPHMQTGGHVQQGGLARLHAGESVIPGGAEASGILKEMLNVQREQSIYMRSVFGVWTEAGLTKRVLKKMISPFTIPWKIARMFRKTKGVYKGQLSKASMPLENIAENVGTLFEGLMWRLDNMMEVMKANAQANRDHSTFVTKIKYPPIEGVRMRRPAFSLIRKAGKMAIAPAAFAAKGLIGGGLGISGMLMAALTGDLSYLDESKSMMGSLTKKRGLYKNEEGLGSSIMGAVRPRSREQLLGEYRHDDESMMGPGGGRAGDGRKLTLFKKAQVYARVFTKELGGKRGYDKPIWVRTHQTKNLKDAKSLQNISDSTKKLKETQESWFKKAKKWKFLDILGKAGSGIWSMISLPFKLIGGLLGGLRGGIGGLFKGGLKGAGTIGLIGGLLKFLGIPALIFGGLTLWGWLDKKYPRGTELGKGPIGEVVKALRDSNMLGTGFDLGSSITSAFTTAIKEMIKGEKDLETIVKEAVTESFTSFMNKRIKTSTGLTLDELREGLTTDDPDRRKALAKKAEEGFYKSKYGKDAKIMEAKRKEISKAKGFFGTTRAILDYSVSGLQSKMWYMDPKASTLEQKNIMVKEKAARELISKHGFTPEQAKEKLDQITNTLDPTSKAFADPKRLVEIARTGKNPYIDSGMQQKLIKPKSPRDVSSFSPIQSHSLAKNEIQIEAATVRIGSTSTSKAIENLGLEQSKNREKATVNIMTSQNMTSQEIINSSPSTTINGGGGLGSLDSGDPISHQNYLSPRQ